MKFDDIRQALTQLLETANGDAVVTIDSGVPGPVVGLTALTHGNEISGVITADRIVRGINDGHWQMTRGKLMVLLSNYEILLGAGGFEELVRHRGVDLNRIWNVELARPDPGQAGSAEFAVRDRLWPYLEKIDSLIDLHSTSLKSTAIGIVMTGSDPTLNALRSVLDVPFLMPDIGNHLNGTAMIEAHHSLRNARAGAGETGDLTDFSLVIEAGQHFDFGTVDRNVANVAALLQHCGVLKGVARTPPRSPLVLSTYYVGLARSAGSVIDWIYADNPAGFDRVANGTHVCNLHGEPVVARGDSYIVMPQLEARNPGQELFYLATPRN